MTKKVKGNKMSVKNQLKNHSLKMSSSSVIGYARVSSQNQSNNTSLPHRTNIFHQRIADIFIWQHEL